MPIKQKYIDDLDRNLRVHQRLMTLAQSEDECAVHETLVHLGRNPRVLEVLGQIEDYPEILSRVEKIGLQAFAETKGIYIPPKANVVFAKAGDDKWFGGIRTSDGLLWGYEGGDDGRGWVCGEEDKSGGGGGGAGGGGGGQTPPPA